MARVQLLGLLLLAVTVYGQQTPPQLLMFDTPMNDTLGGTGSDDQWKITVPIDPQTDQTVWFSVTVYPLMGPDLTTGYIPTLAVTASNISDIRYNDTASGFVLATATYPYESIIVPPISATGETKSIYIMVQVVNASSSVEYIISASRVIDALDPSFFVSSTAGVLQIDAQVRSGVRTFYQLNTHAPAQIVIEECASLDKIGNSNPVSAAFLYNTTSDQLVDYNQQYVDYPCGNEYQGTIVVSDPQNTNDSRFLKVCPTVINFSAGLNNNTLFAIEVLRFWQVPVVFGSVNYSITIYTNQLMGFPLESPTDDPENPPFVEIAPLDIDWEYPDIVIEFRPWTFADGTPLTGVVSYGVFTDFAFDAYYRENLVSNNSLANACFLIANQATMLYNNQWYDSTVIEKDGENFEITLAGFYDQVPNSTVAYHVNIVAKSATYGTFAYTYSVVNVTEAVSSQDDGLEGWAIALIVIGSIIGAIIVSVSVIGAAAFFIRQHKRNQYELMG